MGSDVDAVTKSGRLFHTRPAATGNARSRQWTAAMEERRERVLTPSAGAAAYRGRQHAGSRWRGTVAHNGRWPSSGSADQSRSFVQSHAPGAGKAACGSAARSTSGSDGSHEVHSSSLQVCNDVASSLRRSLERSCAQPSSPAASSAPFHRSTCEPSASYDPFSSQRHLTKTKKLTTTPKLRGAIFCARLVFMSF